MSFSVDVDSRGFRLGTRMHRNCGVTQRRKCRASSIGSPARSCPFFCSQKKRGGGLYPERIRLFSEKATIQQPPITDLKSQSFFFLHTSLNSWAGELFCGRFCAEERDRLQHAIFELITWLITFCHVRKKNGRRTGGGQTSRLLAVELVKP